MSTKELKENIIKELSKLPVESLKEINDLVSYILSKTAQPQEKLNILKDTLAEFIGSIKHGFLASGIDDELYGTKD